MGIYIHIPYCLQKCHYCDFVKFEVSELPPLNDYVKLLLKELKLNSKFYPKKAQSLYFGGGTPSLLSTEQVATLMSSVKDLYGLEKNAEVTLEINPGTLSSQKVSDLMKLGVNRFSLGLQSFHDQFLRACGRQHSSHDSLKDLKLFKEVGLNYSVDLLFGLPHQSLRNLEKDLDLLLPFDPPHVSPYNLTLPEAHFYNKNRASHDEQVKMMDLIQNRLAKHQIFRYEISNFAQVSKESLHNKIYWEDRDYLGFGLGAHSYIKSPPWGKRFWNTNIYSKYAQGLDLKGSPHVKTEHLKAHEALTDFCHTSLRQTQGLSKQKTQKKFVSLPLDELLWPRLEELKKRGLVFYKDRYWALTSTGFEIPNEVFKTLCFLEEDLTHDQ